jgi:hypothetical protein
MPHGSEWKNVFALLLTRCPDKKVFPDDIHEAIIKSMSNLSASTCSDPALFRVLQKYDPHKEQLSLVESVGIGNTFKTSDGKLFKIMNKRRTRYECIEIDSGRKYLFPGIYEVLQE